MNDSNFLKEIGRSYIVSAFLPAAIFVLLAYFLFRGFIPSALLKQAGQAALFHDYQWVVLFLLTAWLAFYLFSANDYTVRIFEGYLFPEWLKDLLAQRQRQRVEEILKQINSLHQARQDLLYQKEQDGYFDPDKAEQYTDDILRLRTRLANFSLQSPLSVKNVMPTRLGNILRASEMYAYERYRIEEITIWPRLFNVLPTEYIRTLEEKHNHFMFLINSAFLALSTALASLFFCLLGLPLLVSMPAMQYLSPKVAGFFTVGFDFVSPFGYFLISLALLGFGYVMYEIAVNSARDLGAFICASFDLYRGNLLTQMNWYPPKTITDERILWDDLSRFLATGTKLGEIQLPQFQQAETPKSAKKRSARVVKYVIESEADPALKVR